VSVPPSLLGLGSHIVPPFDRFPFFPPKSPFPGGSLMYPKIPPAPLPLFYPQLTFQNSSGSGRPPSLVHRGVSERSPAAPSLTHGRPQIFLDFPDCFFLEFPDRRSVSFPASAFGFFRLRVLLEGSSTVLNSPPRVLFAGPPPVVRELLTLDQCFPLFWAQSLPSAPL